MTPRREFIIQHKNVITNDVLRCVKLMSSNVSVLDYNTHTHDMSKLDGSHCETKEKKDVHTHTHTNTIYLIKIRTVTIR